MANGCESNHQTAFGEDEEWTHLNMKDAIAYLSQRLTINDWRRVLRAFGKTNVEIEFVMLEYYHYSTSDMIHTYLTRWFDCNPNANLRELIKTLRKSELHLYASHLNYLFNLTKCDTDTQEDSDTDETCVENPNASLILVSKCCNAGTIPCKRSVRAAGFDLCADSDYTLPKNCWTEVRTGVRIRIPRDYYGKISSRSCLAFGARVFAFEAVIDSNFTDEIKVLMRNDGDSTFVIGKGDRIAQVVIAKIHERFTMTVVHGDEPPRKKQRLE